MKPTKNVFETLHSTTTAYRLENGDHHREDGPAYVFEHDNGDRYEAWAYNDKIHRYGGPARTFANGRKQYYIHGLEVTKKVEAWLSDMGYDWETMSDIEKWELEMFMRSL